MTIHSVVIQKLLSTNAQIGRRVAAHHLKVYTYGMRNKMVMFDSDKTLICMRSALNFIGSLARQRARFMFVNTNPLFDEIFEQMTKKIGCYSPSVNALWRTGGFLTNSNSPKKFRSRSKRLSFGPTQPPDCLVIVDTERKSTVIKEAYKLQIPIVALVDSGMPLEFYKRIAYPIPANDSVQFVYMFCNLITKTLLLEQKKLSSTEDEFSSQQAREAKRIKEKKRKIKFTKGELAVVPYADITLVSEDIEETKKLLDKLVVVKLNAGLGTKMMGLDIPKSTVNVSDGLTFLDLIINQIETLNSKYECGVPLVLLNTSDIHDNTLKILEKYSTSSINIQAFKQDQGSEVILSGDHLGKGEVCPFENGGAFLSLAESGTLDLLLTQGKEYILVINSDNVATVIDPSILNYLLNNKIDCCIEVTQGHSSDFHSQLRNFKLQEIARNPDKQMKDQFKLIDTTNMWVNLRAIKRLVDTDKLKYNNQSVSKENDIDQSLLQKTAAGSTIQFFERAIGVSVPESRYLPLNTTTDLLLIQSDLYTSKEGVLTRNPNRADPIDPEIHLGPEFEKVGDFQSRFKSIPSIVGLDSLTVTGDVWFGDNITLKGVVTIAAKPGMKLEIPEGVVIENKVISDTADI
ncbi:UTP--glucose-1-phosphate uridylyltransferase-like isoform X2 [Prosopis cineraria]|uniref:UTP--glucose-1-phosphate uridylyltransferase-like isoform X2 n=1 Tax=Prosopis cineraria TaxID=364024 RepID=UPI00240EEC67|nr:UTP--glucose-1-phosphate uridylyltransferase-like isoform X2 [Prosopis cineraria]